MGILVATNPPDLCANHTPDAEASLSLVSSVNLKEIYVLSYLLIFYCIKSFQMGNAAIPHLVADALAEHQLALPPVG